LKMNHSTRRRSKFVAVQHRRVLAGREQIIRVIFSPELPATVSSAGRLPHLEMRHGQEIRETNSVQPGTVWKDDSACCPTEQESHRYVCPIRLQCHSCRWRTKLPWE